MSTTAATSVTGFGFPIHGMTPGIAFGIITLVILPISTYARYSRQLAGVWRPVYIVGVVFTLYLNFVVLIVQAFQKITALHTLAPAQSEPPFLRLNSSHWSDSSYSPFGDFALGRGDLYRASASARHTAALPESPA
ncbi:MAG: hypothetical protein QM775_28770 [Pirellulales bacterium]